MTLPRPRIPFGACQTHHGSVPECVGGKSAGVTGERVGAGTGPSRGRDSEDAPLGSGAFAAPVIRVGHQIKIPTAYLLDLLGLSTDSVASHPAPGSSA